MQIVYMLLPK